MKFYFLALGTLLIVCVGCATDGQQVFHKNEYHAPPAEMLAHPGPGVTGPGPGVMQAAYMASMEAQQPSMAARATQVSFSGPDGMMIGWQIGESFADGQVVAPGRYSFPQAATYRLKLSNIPGPGREGLVLYPTLQVYPAHPTTEAFLAHSTIPLRLTDEDISQVESSNFVTKVIYLPDPKFQPLAVAGVTEIVSTRLNPGVDPVAEADRLGTIMLVLRVGNADFQGDSGIRQTGAVTQVDGTQGQHAAPVPIGGLDAYAVPGDIITGMSGGPGRPAVPMVAGMGAPVWGMPITGTPIGLPGPPHLPLGTPASLRSHTVRNLTDYDVPPPTKHFLLDVKHEPGIRMPAPVNHVEYTEKHPVYKDGEVSWPAWADPTAGGGAGGPGQAYCPPQQ